MLRPAARSESWHRIISWHRVISECSAGQKQEFKGMIQGNRSFLHTPRKEAHFRLGSKIELSEVVN